MTRKTKKEKLRIAQRKQLHDHSQKNYNNTLPTLIQPLREEKKEAEKEDKKQLILEPDQGLNKFFRNDLKKSLMIICVIIALEIVIYYATINKYF